MPRTPPLPSTTAWSGSTVSCTARARPTRSSPEPPHPLDTPDRGIRGENGPVPSADDSPLKFDAIAVELYALPPEQFTAQRNARAAAERDLTARLKALRKPTVAAWAVSLLARDGQLGDALELAAALREAQDDLDAAELKGLSVQRRSLVAALSKQAVALAGERGVTVSAATRDDVDKTINAAVMDAGAAAAVMSGRLVRALE